MQFPIFTAFPQLCNDDPLKHNISQFLFFDSQYSGSTQEALKWSSKGANGLYFCHATLSSVFLPRATYFDATTPFSCKTLALSWALAKWGQNDLDLPILAQHIGPGVSRFPVSPLNPSLSLYSQSEANILHLHRIFRFWQRHPSQKSSAHFLIAMISDRNLHHFKQF